MFLRHKLRRKDGKEHRYWSIVENRRVSGGRTVQRHVLYLGEINDSQRAAWCQTIEAFDDDGQAGKQIALFSEDRAAPPIGLRCRACQAQQPAAPPAAAMGWLLAGVPSVGSASAGCVLVAAPASVTARTRWLNVLKTLVAYRLIDPGSEWRLHRQWYERSAMGDLLGEDFDLVQKDICIAASTGC